MDQVVSESFSLQNLHVHKEQYRCMNENLKIDNITITVDVQEYLSSHRLRNSLSPSTITTANMSENYSRKQNGSGGMASATKTPANSHVGLDKARMFDAEGTIGKNFTGTSPNQGIVSPYHSCTQARTDSQKQRAESSVAQHRRSEVLLLKTEPLASSSRPREALVARCRIALAGSSPRATRMPSECTEEI